MPSWRSLTKKAGSGGVRIRIVPKCHGSTTLFAMSKVLLMFSVFTYFFNIRRVRPRNHIPLLIVNNLINVTELEHNNIWQVHRYRPVARYRLHHTVPPYRRTVQCLWIDSRPRRNSFASRRQPEIKMVRLFKGTVSRDRLDFWWMDRSRPE
jgi:hypothetical protein